MRAASACAFDGSSVAPFESPCAERSSARALSAFDLEPQIASDGTTWLDRELTARNHLPIAETGFGREVNDALDRRAQRLVDMGLATARDGWFHVSGGLARIWSGKR